MVVVVALDLPSAEDQYAQLIDEGQRYMDQMDLDGAIDAFTRAIQLDGSRPEAYVLLADIYLDDGDVETAQTLLELGYSATGDSSLAESAAQIRLIEEVAEEEAGQEGTDTGRPDETIVVEVIPDTEEETGQEGTDIIRPEETFEVAVIQDTDDLGFGLDDEDYYDNAIDAGQEIRQHLEDRDSTFTIQYIVSKDEYGEVDKDEIDTLVWDSVDYAQEHTGVSTQGDSLRWCYRSASCSSMIQIPSVGTVAYVSTTFTFDYYDTAEQEAVLVSAIDSLVEELGLNYMSDYDKVCTIYDYISHHVIYDYAHKEDDSYVLKATAYAALINGTAVCQGYALLFYRMALECGLDARFIYGTGGGGDHSWNIVELDGVYYDLDVTWASNYMEYGAEYPYFLVTDADFPDHYRDEEFTTAEFYSQYPMAVTDYAA